MATYDHWLPLHIGDYVADTLHLTTLQHGAYLLLIMHYFKHRGLPDDDHALAQIARLRIDHWRRISPRVMALFQRKSAHKQAKRWVHKRIDAELERASNGKEKPTSPNKKFSATGLYPPVTQSRSDRGSSTHARAGAATHSQNHKNTHTPPSQAATAAHAADVCVNGKSHKTKQTCGALAVLEILANDKTRH